MCDDLTRREMAARGIYGARLERELKTRRLTAGQRVGRFCLYLLGAVAYLIFAYLIAMVLVPKARAHDHWINRGGYQNSIGEFCCGEGDRTYPLRACSMPVALLTRPRVV